MRVLDIDLDFFVHGVTHRRNSAGDRLDRRLPGLVFGRGDVLLDRLLQPVRPPGRAVEHYGEALWLWRSAIREGRVSTPLHLTHVDAHADRGQGDSGWVQLMSETLHKPVDQRDEPHDGSFGIGDGNWVSFAVGCRWVNDIR